MAESAAEARQKQLAEQLEGLCSPGRQCGGVTAEQMAFQYHKQLCPTLLRRCLSAWEKYVAVPAAESGQELLAKQRESLRSQERQRCDAPAEQMASRRHKKRCLVLLQGRLSA